MELLLNVVWAIVACGAFLVLLPRSRGGNVSILGIACVAALLFPIISVSDDLSVSRDAWEESSSIRRADARADAFATAHDAVVPAVASIVAVTLFALGLIDTQVVPAAIRLLPAQSDPRSPPL